MKDTQEKIVELQKVESSNIAEIGYDANSGRLRVRFISSGGLYEYDDVPKNVAEDFLKSDSKGRFFHKNIRHQHVGKKIDETKEDEAANDADSPLQDTDVQAAGKAVSKSQQRRHKAQGKKTSKKTSRGDGDN